MLKTHPLFKVEQVLSAAWRGEVRLAQLHSYDDHPHVSRLNVVQAPAGAPETVFLKRARAEGEDRFDAGCSIDQLFNDWASLEFLHSVFSAEPICPRLIAGSREAGLLVLEDLTGERPLEQLLQAGKAGQAARALVDYARLLGRLHGGTAGRLAGFVAARQRFHSEESALPENYVDEFRYQTDDLARLGLPVPPPALLELQQAANRLTQPGDFCAFTHGDAVFSNIIERQGRLQLLDFEAGRFRHALYEGAFLRMHFPTSGLLYVRRIPDAVWRQAETAYRETLSVFLPAVKDDACFGPAITAACAFWVLSFYAVWLERASDEGIDADRLAHLRRCLIMRGELFAATTREFHCMPQLGEYVVSVVSRLRAQWQPTDCELPLYPAFAS